MYLEGGREVGRNLTILMSIMNQLPAEILAQKPVPWSLNTNFNSFISFEEMHSRLWLSVLSLYTSGCSLEILTCCTKTVLRKLHQQIGDIRVLLVHFKKCCISDCKDSENIFILLAGDCSFHYLLIVTYRAQKENKSPGYPQDANQ